MRKKIRLLRKRRIEKEKSLEKNKKKLNLRRFFLFFLFTYTSQLFPKHSKRLIHVLFDSGE